jgi:hypothetical protein
MGRGGGRKQVEGGGGVPWAGVGGRTIMKAEGQGKGRKGSEQSP